MMRQKSWNQFKKTMAASTLAGAIAFTGCAVMPSVTAFADTTEQTGQCSAFWMKECRVVCYPG